MKHNLDHLKNQAVEQVAALEEEVKKVAIVIFPKIIFIIYLYNPLIIIYIFLRLLRLFKYYNGFIRKSILKW